MTCERHEPSWIDGQGYMCEKCNLQICTDCGCRPAHEDCPANYCRRCSEKGGHRYAFNTPIDHDLLRAKVGRELAAQIIIECEYK